MKRLKSSSKNSHTLSFAALFSAGVYCLSPWGSSAVALALGVAIAVVLGNPIIEKTRVYSQQLLTLSIIGLGAGMNLEKVAQAGISGLGFTLASILLTLALGLFLGQIFGTESDASILISVGTAICGGSAIAAIAPVIKAKSHSMAVALGTVFMLNAVALVIFPIIGRYFELSQSQFGYWSALAIHDTSSVIGAGLQYGAEALQIGTTVKLARALWIVPLTLAFGYLSKGKKDESGAKAKKPWFILGFLAMAAVVTWIPQLQSAGHIVELVAQKGLVLTLFFIGSNLSRETMKQVGIKPFLQGFTLWVVVSISTLTIIRW